MACPAQASGAGGAGTDRGPQGGERPGAPFLVADIHEGYRAPGQAAALLLKKRCPVSRGRVAPRAGRLSCGTFGCRVPACAGIYVIRLARCSLGSADVLKPGGAPPDQVDCPPCNLPFEVHSAEGNS